MWLYVSTIVVIVTYALYRYFTRTFNHWKDSNVVGPEPWPFFGNTADVTFQRRFIGTVIEEIYNKYPNEKIVGFYRMTVPYLLVRDPDIIKHILIKDFDVFADRGFKLDEEGLGANLFTTDSETWRVLRAKFSPIFTSGKLKNMLPLIIERADRFVANTFETADIEGLAIDVQAVSRNFTMSTIAACAFGLDLNINDPSLKILKKLDKLSFESSYLLEFLFMYPSLLKVFDRAVFPKEITDFFFGLVKTVFEQRNYKPSSRNDFMDLILEMKQQKVISSNKTVDESELSVELTDAMIAAQAFIFYIAGFETSSTTLGYLLYELTKYPNIQNKLIEEIDSTLEKNNGIIDFDSLMSMQYMSKVFDETLRMYPIVDPLQRVALVDYKIPETEITIKKGTFVFVSVAGIQHDKQYYPDPNVFDPERFAPENAGDRHSCVYLPFGNGPRNCIGMRFSKVQSRLFLLKVLSKYRVQACKDTPKKLESDPKRAVLGPHKPIVLQFIQRTDK